jgi:CRP/FNR family transcriptional regulator
MPQDCKTCPFREEGFLRKQPDEAVDYFSNLLNRLRVYGQGKSLVHQDEATDRLTFVCNGLVKMSRVIDDGEEVILGFVRPCSVIGGINARSRSNVSYWAAEALTEVTDVAHITSENLLRVFRAHPDLGFGFFRHMSGRLRLAYRRIGSMRLPVEEKLLAVLAHLMFLFYGVCENRIIEIPFSRRLLARFAEMTPETLSRTLRALQKKGIINVEKRGIRILQAEALRKYSEAPNERP